MKPILQTHIKNKLDVGRKVRWVGISGIWLDAGKDVIVDGGYPTACRNPGMVNEMISELEAGSVDIRIITNLPTGVPHPSPGTMRKPSAVEKLEASAKDRKAIEKGRLSEEQLLIQGELEKFSRGAPVMMDAGDAPKHPREGEEIPKPRTVILGGEDSLKHPDDPKSYPDGKKDLHFTDVFADAGSKQQSVEGPLAGVLDDESGEEEQSEEPEKKPARRTRSRSKTSAKRTSVSK